VALDDLDSAALYFASMVSVRIAADFLAEYDVLEVIQSNQRLGTPLGGEMREYQFTGFGYSLFYAEDEVLRPHIYAVANQSREPGYWAWRV
jgi:hypothetical protein